MAKPNRPKKGETRYTPVKGKEPGENKFSVRGAADKIRARQSRNMRAYNQLGN